ncbi:MAG TPA: PhzF family phenazine biosynthesis protein [Blastocatellia bacterium]|nr:PhzF family phenazine biosynthesis protein [Blastocatellia bacterium]
MNKQSFIIADVFTEKQFGGNQLAVFTDARGLDAETMQDIAREMHFSETTFLFPPESGGDYRVRSFTPETELPFAGHPLVGTGYVVVAERLKSWSAPTTTVTLEAGVGPITVEVNTENERAGHTVMTQPLPIVRGAFADVTALAKALSLEPAEIESTGLPVEAIYNGLAVLVVPVASLAAIKRIKPDAGALERISDEMGAQTVLTFARETEMESSTAHCRVFAPAAGVIEDAATGSANGPLGFYLVRHRVVEAQAVTRVLSEQGFEMRRPSLLHIEVDVDPLSNEVAGVRVGGGVVISGRGEIFLP